MSRYASLWVVMRRYESLWVVMGRNTISYEYECWWHLSSPI